MRVEYSNAPSAQHGLTLIELVIALSIGAFMMLGAVSLFLQSHTSFLQDEETARLQENGRWALRLVSREISMAGFFGGITDATGITTSLTVVGDCGTDWALTPGPGIEHLDNPGASAAAAAMGCLSNVDLLPGSDVIAVKRVKDTAHVFDGTQVAAPAAQATYLRVEEYNANSSFIRGSNITTADKTAGSMVDVWEYQPQVFFIRDHSFEETDNIPSLCRRRLTRDAATLAMDSIDCMVEGIENMQVEFGIDTSTPLDYSPDYYDASPTSAELSRAVAAKVYLLARSVQPVAGYTDDRSYQLGTTTVAAANDKFYRKVFQTTVMLRNSGAFGF